MAEISKDHKYNIQHVKTSVASHRKQFERTIAVKLLATSGHGFRNLYKTFKFEKEKNSSPHLTDLFALPGLHHQTIEESLTEENLSSEG